MKKNYFSEFVWVAGFIVFFIILKTSVTGFYLVPTTSMLPNVKPGDRVVINKLSYGFWLPFGSSPIVKWGEPKRGDIVFFNAPNGEGTFVKRIIGLSGDTISFHKGFITINGLQVLHSYIGNSDSKSFENNLILEENKDLQLPAHLILMSKDPDKTYFESGRFIVPPHKVFVLGDNRDSSVDSRVFGFVDEKSLYGKALFVLFSTAGNTGLFPEFRTNRFFKSID